MPWRFHFDHARQLVVAEVTGPVTGQELLEMQRELHSDPGFSPRMAQLCDFRLAEMGAVASPDIRQIVDRSPSPPDRGRRAIVVAAGFAYGLARMFGTHANMQGQPTEVFTDLAGAMAWLEIGDDAPGPAPDNAAG